MAGVFQHVFVSAKADSADATKVRKTNWNDFLKMGHPGEETA
jgi:hypothetical protein